MGKIFNITGVCIPTRHYMVDISRQLGQIRTLIDQGAYFTINRARQYGKTTTLYALNRFLGDDYLVVNLDFQALDTAKFADGNIFSLTFARYFLQRISAEPSYSGRITRLSFRIGYGSLRRKKRVFIV